MSALVTDSGRKTPARLASSAILACQSDERLLKLFRSGHDRAFDAIVERYRKQLVRFCTRILPESRCEDAVQQAFVNAHSALRSSDEAIVLKAWLFAVTRNAALNMLRQNGWNHEQIPLDFDGVRRPDQVVEQRFELQRTVAALNALPERQRDALVMREFEGRSYDEIALALGANDGAVRQLLNRARGTLRAAASALIPPPLVARAASLPPSDGRRIAEVVGGLGAAGMAKAGATALVAGSLVVGAVNAPLPLGESHKPHREKATITAAKDRPARSANAAAAVTVPAALLPVAAVTPSSRAKSRRGSQRHSSGNSGPGHAPVAEHHGTGPSSRSGPGRGEREHRSGSGGDRTQPGTDDHRTTTRSGSDDGSHSGTGGSGTSGSDDSTTSSGGSDDSTSGSPDTSGTSGTGSGESTSGSSDTTSSYETSGSGSGSDGSSTETGTSTTTTSTLEDH